MTEPLRMAIRGTGSAVPARVMANKEFETFLDTSDEWIRTRTGIRERRIAQDGETTACLAVDAAERALEDAGLTPRDLDLILCATITPELPFPATACLVQERLGLTDIPAFDISAACSGFVYGLVIAAHFVHQKTYRTILVIGAENMTRFTDFQDRTTCILFGDAAGAAVVTDAEDASQRMLYCSLGADGSGADMIWVPAGGARQPASIETVNQRLHYMKMKGREVYRFAVTKMQEVIEQTLQATGISPDELAMVIPHQSNVRIIESARQKIGLPPEKMCVNIDRYGNTSAASIPLALDELRRAGRLKRGDLVLMVAFGAGLTWASALVRL